MKTWEGIYRRKKNDMNIKLFRNTKIPYLFDTNHKFKSLIHVLLFVVYHLYILQNVLG
jgi:hypothetical protein